MGLVDQAVDLLETEVSNVKENYSIDKVGFQ